MADAALGAFAVFFMQSPSFLAHQRDMQRLKGQNNAASLFGLDAVPSDPQIRNLLDPVPPEHLAAPFWQVFEQLRAGDYLQAYQGHLGPWLCALDGTQYFGSREDSLCPMQHAGGQRPHLLLAQPGGAADRGAGREPGALRWSRSSSARRMAARSRIANCGPPNAGWSATPGALRRVR